MTKAKILLPACIAFLALVGTAATAQEFLSYEGRDSVHDGQGGERKTVNGIDFWMTGTPPKRFQVIGSLTDERRKSGLWGAIAMSSLDNDIAKAAKKAGGDAVILSNASDEVTGMTGSAFGSSSGNVTGSYGGGMFGAAGNSFSDSFGVTTIRKEHESKYIVVKYLPDPAPAPASAAIPTPNVAPASTPAAAGH